MSTVYCMSMSKSRDKFVDHYALLGVLPGATETDIRRAYMKLAKALHPDLDGGDAVQMQALNSAYQTLKDDGRRRAYDLMHQTETGTAKLSYRYGDDPDHDAHLSAMSDDEVDDFINSVFHEFRAEQAQKSTLKDIKSKISLKRTKKKQ